MTIFPLHHEASVLWVAREKRLYSHSPVEDEQCFFGFQDILTTLLLHVSKY